MATWGGVGFIVAMTGVLVLMVTLYNGMGLGVFLPAGFPAPGLVLEALQPFAAASATIHEAGLPHTFSERQNVRIGGDLRRLLAYMYATQCCVVLSISTGSQRSASPFSGSSRWRAIRISAAVWTPSSPLRRAARGCWKWVRQ